MADTTGLGTATRGTASERTGALSEEAFTASLRRRGLSPRTCRELASMVRRCDRICAELGFSIGALSRPELEELLGRLPQTRSTLSTARSALRHYWSAAGREDAPLVDVVARVGRSGKDPLEGLAARERFERASQGDGLAWCGASVPPWLADGLRGRQLARTSVRSYLVALRRCQSWCLAAGTTIDRMNGPELEAFLEQTPFTRSNRMMFRSALIHYYALTGRQDPPTWAVRVPRRRRMVAKPLDLEEARQLEGAALARRDRKGLAVIIGLYLGLRRFEIAKLRWDDFQDGWVRLVGKGDVEASLPVHPVVLRYLALIPREGPFVFPGQAGKGSANPTTLWLWVREVSLEAIGRAVPTHILRHTALATANDITGNLRAVQDFARHAQADTTAGYTRTTRQRLQEVSEAIGDAYRDGAAESELTTLPMLPFAELVATTQGAEAVEGWTELAKVLGSRPGWHLVGSMDGSGVLKFEFSPLLGADVMTWTNGKAPQFEVMLTTGPGPEDFDCWTFPTAAALLEVLPALEAGHPAPVEPDYQLRLPLPEFHPV